jgi:hypothetical protein
MSSKYYRKKVIHFKVLHFSRSIEVDYDTDESGIYRAKSSRPETEGARTILDSSSTKVDLPVDLMPAEEVKDEAKWDARFEMFLGEKIFLSS